ncbi:MAG TPA: non-homologous end-joining DNA ligase [Solirubrobacter sp.]|nr:non-homologous end-joining DNA ligase [Solirubrobacter sp.]
MADGLDAYRAKRDFDATPEPAGAPAQAGEQRFVVQEHSARAMHWDLRLEHDGALASWAVPKGIPVDPKRNHLAVRTEDHPLEYLDFHGDIPAGQYGAGTMRIFDHGTFEVHKWREAEVMITFHGERVRGKYVLFRTNGKNWMIHRMDPPEDPDAEPMPERIEPMLARISRTLPAGDEWAYEIKWDGVRAVGYAEGGRLRLESRRGNAITARYPELRALGRALGVREAILDGEIVALDEHGRPSFQRLQRRMHLTSDGMVRRLSQSEPVVYMIFDLLWLDGHALLGEPYAARRAALQALELAGPCWQVPAYHVGNGPGLLEATKQQGLEGLVAKRLDGTYLPGRRSPGWLKVKNVRSTDVVVGGWVGGDGGRLGRIGALTIGFTAEDGTLRYAGKVGTGFTDAELTRLQGIVDPLACAESPFTGPQPEKGTHFVDPVLVARVDYGDVTEAGTLRHPVYKGLRDDLDAAEATQPVLREPESDPSE